MLTSKGPSSSSSATSSLLSSSSSSSSSLHPVRNGLLAMHSKNNSNSNGISLPSSTSSTFRSAPLTRGEQRCLIMVFLFSIVYLVIYTYAPPISHFSTSLPPPRRDGSTLPNFKRPSSFLKHNSNDDDDDSTSRHALHALAASQLVGPAYELARQASYGVPCVDADRAACTPFLLGRSRPDLFVSAWSNHGAGVGHQFGEWIHGVYAAVRFNLSFVDHGFLGRGYMWTSYLGLGYGEDTEEDVFAGPWRVRLLEWREQDAAKGGRGSTDAWLAKQIAEHDKRVAERAKRATAAGAAVSADDTSDDSVDEVTLLRLYRVHVPTLKYGCEPRVNLFIRQKYCAARVREPLSAQDDLYAEDRSAKRLIVALHLRCGDSCFNSFRASSFTSVQRTMQLLRDALIPEFGELAVHIFSQRPSNDTAEHHFAPLLVSKPFKGLIVRTHFDYPVHITLHHLVVADVFLAAQSSFSWIATLLHNIVALGPGEVQPCNWGGLTYDKATGEFDVERFMQMLKASRRYRPQFDSMQDCEEIVPLDEEVGLVPVKPKK